MATTTPASPQQQQTNLGPFFEKLEARTQLLGESLSHVSGSLRSSLLATTAMTLSYAEVYEKSVHGLCTTVQSNTQEMREFIKQCEETNDYLTQMKKLHDEMYTNFCNICNNCSKQMKRLVDYLDDEFLTPEMQQQLQQQ